MAGPPGQMTTPGASGASAKFRGGPSARASPMSATTQGPRMPQQDPAIFTVTDRKVRMPPCISAHCPERLVFQARSLNHLQPEFAQKSVLFLSAHQCACTLRRTWQFYCQFVAGVFKLYRGTVFQYGYVQHCIYSLFKVMANSLIWGVTVGR